MSEFDAGDLAPVALTLARRFAAGATLWCVSVGSAHHARHLAVEFVHPVIVGKRALPAVAVNGDDIVTTLRALASPGDVVAIVGESSGPTVSALVRRCDAWGLSSIVLASGETAPAMELATHAVSVAATATDAEVVLAYHLLWELTHVVFEHPGLLTEPAERCSDEVCITCSDEGSVAEIVALDGGATAVVLADGRREVVDTSLVDASGPGDLVLVHAGVALALIPEGEQDRGAP